MLTFPGLDVVQSKMIHDQKVQQDIKNGNKFLNYMYERCIEGNKHVTKDELGRDLGFDNDLLNYYSRYYMYRRLIESLGLEGPYSLTFDGMNEVTSRSGNI